MGNTNTLDKGMKVYIKQEFEKVKQENCQRQYLKISEVLKLQHPENYPFSFAHLGILYMIDTQKQGIITMQNLLHFAQVCMRNLKNVQPYEFQSQLQGLATSLLLEHIVKNNIQQLCEWFMTLLMNDEQVTIFQNIQFVKLETVQIMYEICNLKVMSNIDIQQFVDLLQQSGEEAGLMSLDQEELDEYIPLETCQEFIKNFLNGFKSLMTEIGYVN
ncbi:hypothetical protein pb186bvf_019685 [Paramecium bursaria]